MIWQLGFDVLQLEWKGKKRKNCKNLPFACLLPSFLLISSFSPCLVLATYSWCNDRMAWFVWSTIEIRGKKGFWNQNLFLVCCSLPLDEIGFFCLDCFFSFTIQAVWCNRCRLDRWACFGDGLVWRLSLVYRFNWGWWLLELIFGN